MNFTTNNEAKTCRKHPLPWSSASERTRKTTKRTWVRLPNLSLRRRCHRRTMRNTSLPQLLLPRRRLATMFRCLWCITSMKVHCRVKLRCLLVNTPSETRKVCEWIKEALKMQQIVIWDSRDKLPTIKRWSTPKQFKSNWFSKSKIKALRHSISRLIQRHSLRLTMWLIICPFSLVKPCLVWWGTHIKAVMILLTLQIKFQIQRPTETALTPATVPVSNASWISNSEWPTYPTHLSMTRKAA